MIKEKCPKCEVQLEQVTKGNNPLYLRNLYECSKCKTRYRIPHKGDIIKIGGP